MPVIVLSNNDGCAIARNVGWATSAFKAASSGIAPPFTNGRDVTTMDAFPTPVDEMDIGQGLVQAP